MQNSILNPIMKSYKGFKFTICGQSAKSVKVNERDGSISLSVSTRLFSRQLEDGTWDEVNTWVSVKAARGEHHDAVVQAIRAAVADGNSAYIIVHGLLLAHPYLSRSGTAELAYTISVARPEHLKVYKADGERSAWRVAADDFLPNEWPFVRSQGHDSGESYFEQKARAQGQAAPQEAVVVPSEPVVNTSAVDDIPF